VSLGDVQAEVGWPVGVAAGLETTQPPTAEELRLIREELDPGGMYAR
jgi:glutaconate CoA-transferase subunit B